MKSRMENQKASAIVVVKLSAAAVIILGLAACIHSPHGGGCCDTRGDQFIAEKIVDAVYQAPPKRGEKAVTPPMLKGDEYQIVRDSKTANTFKFVPGQTFSGNREEWNKLVLEYRPGSDANKPVPLIVETCANDQTYDDTESTSKKIAARSGYIRANVQNDYVNLDGRGLEFLEGQITFDNMKHIIHIFHIKKINTNKVSLLLFYCEAAHCNHKGMVD